MPIKRLSQSGLLTFEKYSSMLAGNPAYQPVATGFEHIDTRVLQSNQTEISFNLTGLSDTYEHLQIRYVLRKTGGGTEVNYSLLNSFSNNDFSVFMYTHFLTGDGSSVTSGNALDNQRGYLGRAHSNTESFGIVDLLDCFNPNKKLVARSIWGARGDINYVQLRSTWLSAMNISDIGMYCEGGAQFVTGSRFSLYGMRRA